MILPPPALDPEPRTPKKVENLALSPHFGELMRWVGVAAAYGGGAIALALLWSELFAYGDFLPLHGYEPIHAHVMALQEGLFLGLYTVLGTVAAALLGAAAFLSFKRNTLVGLLERSLHSLPDRLWMIVLSVVAVIAALVVGFVVIEEAFLTDDEMAMVFQAQLLRSGRLWAEPTPFPDVFHYAMMVETPRWYGIYPIGHPAMMALSLILTGSVRPILALVIGGWVVLTFLLARRLFDRKTAVLSSVLLCVSPFFFLTSGSLAAELTSGLFLLMAVNAAVRLDDGKPLRLAIMLGLSLGAAYIARPYTALAVGVPLAAWVAWRWFRRDIPVWIPFVALLFAVPFVAIYLWSNAELTGSPWLTPYEVNFPGRFRIGFGQDAFGVIHTPQLALAVAGLTLFELNNWTLGWPLSFAPIACALVLGGVTGRARLLIVLPLCVLVAYMPVPMAGVHDTGPIYYLEVLPMLVILGARGLLLLGQRTKGWLDGRGQELVAWIAVAAALVGCLMFGRQQVEVLRSLAEFNLTPYEVAERTIDGRALIFVDEIQTAPPSSWVLGVRPPSHDLSERLVFGHAVGHAKANEVLRWSEGRRGYYLCRDGTSGDVSLVPLPAP